MFQNAKPSQQCSRVLGGLLVLMGGFCSRGGPLDSPNAVTPGEGVRKPSGYRRFLKGVLPFEQKGYSLG